MPIAIRFWKILSHAAFRRMSATTLTFLVDKRQQKKVDYCNSYYFCGITACGISLDVNVYAVVFTASLLYVNPSIRSSATK